MVFFPDGRPPRVVNTPSGPMMSLGYASGNPNPTAPERPWNEIGPAEQAGGNAGSSIGGIIGGPVGSLIGGIIGATIGGVISGEIWDDPTDGSRRPPLGQVGWPVPFGARLVVLNPDGSIMGVVFGPSNTPWSFRIDDPAIHDAPGMPFDGQVIRDGDGNDFVSLNIFVAGQPPQRGLFDSNPGWALVDGLGNIIPSDGTLPGGYQPGRTLNPDIRDPLGPGGAAPGNPFENSGFEAGLREAMEDILRDIINGTSGGTAPGDDDGDGEPPDEDEDGEPDEEENNDDDESCRNKHPLAIMKASIDNLYKILGGPLFGGDKCKPGGGDFNVNPTEFVRAMADRHFTVTVGSEGRVTAIASKNADISNLVELMGAIASVGYIYSGQYRYATAPTVNDSIVTGDSGFLGGVLQTIFGQPQRRLVDAEEANQWRFEQFDAIMGDWGQTVLIPDANPAEEGNQERRLFLPNLAQAVSEMYILLYETKLSTDTGVHVASKTAIELCATKSHAIQNKYMLDSIIDYLGFDTRESKKSLRLLFTILGQGSKKPDGSAWTEQERNDFARFLRPSDKDIVVTECSDTRTFPFELAELQKAASVIMAVHTQRLSARESNLTKLREIFQTAAIIGLTIQEVRRIKDELNRRRGDRDRTPDEENFDQWLEQFEQGFNAQAGIPEPDKPFGKPLQRRPRVRRVGDRPTPEPPNPTR